MGTVQKTVSTETVQNTFSTGTVQKDMEWSFSDRTIPRDTHRQYNFACVGRTIRPQLMLCSLRNCGKDQQRRHARGNRATHEPTLTSPAHSRSPGQAPENLPMEKKAFHRLSCHSRVRRFFIGKHYPASIFPGMASNDRVFSPFLHCTRGVL